MKRSLTPSRLPAVSAARLAAEGQRFFSQAAAACLAALQGSVDLLRQPLLSELQLASLHRDIDHQSARLNVLVRHVLTGGDPHACQAVALGHSLEPLLDDYRRLSPAHQFRLRLHGQPSTAAFAVPGFLLVMQLLLDNALRRTPGGQIITITGEAAGPETGCRFHIDDAGAELSGAQLDALFECPSLAGATAVYGLGLSLAQCVVAALGGRLWAANAPGQGATFSLSLPTPALTRRWIVTRPRVLLIAAEPGLCASLKAGYEEAGYEVATAASAEAGLDLLPDFDPSLVLLEMSPASPAGQACLDTLRQRSRAAVIFLVAPDDRGAVPDALWQGASDCLVKPFHVRELIARTGAILRRHLAAPLSMREWPGLPQSALVSPMLQ